ncbi:MAG: hypothetical protein R3D85_03440 [Paracoccaceae bacterium]
MNQVLRRSGVAGRFFPGEAAALAEEVARCLAEAGRVFARCRRGRAP